MPENQFTGSAFNQALAENKLVGTRCKGCGALYLPPRPICPACQHSDMEWLEFGGHGRLLAYTQIFIVSSALSAEGFGRTNPFCAGIVRLDEGPSISAQILGIDSSQLDQNAVGLPGSTEFIAAGNKTRLAFRISS